MANFRTVKFTLDMPDFSPTPEPSRHMHDRSISALIICKNEQTVLGPCIESLGFCEEIIIVDSGSTDSTLEVIAAYRSNGSKIKFFHHDWDGFGPQKEFAREQATGEWVLSVDADERVTPALREAILHAISQDGPDAYDMPFLSTFCGREMRHSGWWPDRHLRLFRREKARFSDDVVHEEVVHSGPVGHLDAPMEHHPIRHLDDALRRMQTYSSLGAAKLAARGRKVSFSSGILRGGFAFFSTYVLRRGFLDGREGFLNAAIHSQTVFWKYMKRWMELHQK